MNFKEKEMYDISMPITATMPVYKGKEEKRPKLTVVSDHQTGTAYESKLEFNLHTGTHLDRTLHMIPEGNTVESLDVSQLITPCKVLDHTSVTDKITKGDFEDRDIKAGDFLLFKTKNSFEAILEKDFIYLDASGANYLVNKKISGVGTDALGIERSQPGHETHIVLMNQGIHILEGLRLGEVPEGEYLLIALPLNIVGAEAAPVRALLFK